MIGIVYDDNGTKKIKPLAGSSGSGLPLGTILPLYTSSVPTGYLPCDGSTFDASEFPALYGLLGTNVLPDLREVTLKGAGLTGRSVGNHISSTGLSIGQFVDDRVQSHTHGARIYPGASEASGTGYGVSGTYGGQFVTTSQCSGRSGATTEVKAVGVNYVIKAVSGITEADKDYVAAAVAETVEESLDASLKTYIRNQDILSDPEANTVTSSNKTASYDGYIFTSTTGGSAYNAYINNVAVQTLNAGTVNSFTFVLKKGDTYRMGGTQYSQAYARWYKDRDYTGR